MSIGESSLPAPPPLGAGPGLALRYPLRRNTASIMKIFELVTFKEYERDFFVLLLHNESRCSLNRATNLLVL